MKNKFPILALGIIFALSITAVILSFLYPDFSGDIGSSFGLIIGLLIIVFLTVHFSIKGKRMSSMINSLPEQTLRVVVKAKDIVVKQEFSHAGGDGTGTDGSPPVYEDVTYYQITFETEKQDKWSFNVSIELYSAVLEGDKGILIYKEDNQNKKYFIGFQRQA